jgi:hypothetical protein
VTRRVHRMPGKLVRRALSMTVPGLLLAAPLCGVAAAPAGAASAPQAQATGMAKAPGLAAAGSTAQPASVAAAVRRPPRPARLARPGTDLPAGWQHSPDVAVTVSGDETGLHVLAASEASGYSWHTVATLGNPEVQTSLWIGQSCVTGSGRYAVVVYAPEQVTNTAGAQGALARAAVVNLRTGAVRQLGGGFSIAYFDPGCGAGSQAVLTEGGWGVGTSTAPASTGLVMVNAKTGAMSAPVKVTGQVTSAVPYGGQIAAAGGAGVEEISRAGRTRLLARVPATPYELTPDSSGGLGFQTVTGRSMQLWHLADGHARHVASAGEGSAELRQVGGHVWLMGPRATGLRGLPRQWHAVNAPATAQPSTSGTLVVDSVGAIAPAKGTRSGLDSARPVSISTRLLKGSRRSESFQVPTTAAAVPPAARARPGASPRSAGITQAAQQTAGSATTPVSPDRTCGIALDSPQVQAYQPSFAQVEWAADQTVQGTLTDTRPAGLYGSSLPSYTPQGMFSLPAIDGGGSLPAQVLLGVLTQESNLQQASMHQIQGAASNPLTSFNWYGQWINGETTDTGLVTWANSDCGYGIAQITSGMCAAQGQNNDPECQYQAPLPATQQLAIAVDYQANIAKGAQLLIDDWNQLWAAGIQPDGLTENGPSNSANYIDNWYMALWAYNSGLEPGTSALGNTTGCTPGPSCTDGNGDWGLGYANNPINPAYPPDRPTFPGASSPAYPGPGGATYSNSWDMSHPQYWPYQEKVLAWAYDSIALWDYSKDEYVQAFAFAHGDYFPPPKDEFCTPADNCNAGSIDYTKATGPDACQLSGSYADHCWWHVEPDSQNWPILTPGSDVCETESCGTSVLTYAAGAAVPAAEPIPAQYQQTCTESPLPSSAVIVGDGGQAALGCPGQDWTPAGSFAWKFGTDSNGNYSSKIDFDQIGGGFGGHFWFGYTQPSNLASESSVVPASGYADQVITGTWTPPSSVTGWTQVEAAIPSYGDQADKATYQVSPGGGQPARNVQIDQLSTAGTNTWVSLGYFKLASGAKVSLSNVTADGFLGVDIAWSAMAFIKTASPQVNYVAMGDSYSSGEGNSPYFPDSDTSTDSCHRSTEDAYPMQVTLSGQTTPIASTTADGFNFIACSGAETTGIADEAINPVLDPSAAYPANETSYNLAGNTDWGYTQHDAPWDENGGPPEGMQADASYLTTSTALVTISIGGNDARFADVIFGCLTTSFVNNDCSADGWTLTRKSSGALDPEPMKQFEPTVISYLTAHLVQAYLAINDVAPSADIIVAGYPNIFPASPTSSCDSGSVLGKAASLSVNAQEMLNDFGTDLNNAISQAVATVKSDGVDIQFVNPTAGFASHELCSGSSWFLPLSLTNQASSYHPSPAGQQEYATLVNQCLAGTVSC